MEGRKIPGLGANRIRRSGPYDGIGGNGRRMPYRDRGEIPCNGTSACKGQGFVVPDRGWVQKATQRS